VRPHSLVAFAALCTLPRLAAAQGAPVVDTILIEARNIFASDEARGNTLFRVTNALHVTTQPYVVRRELLFRAGEGFDSARVAETERNLRALGIFRDITIDTVRIDDRLAVRVVTADGWTTNLNVGGRSTGDVFTWQLGLFERNFLGTANQAGLSYSKEVDRNVFRVQGRVNRALGTRLIINGLYDDLSDGQQGRWSAAVPFRALSDREAIRYSGEAARRRVLQFRDGEEFARFWRTAQIHRLSAAFAPRAGPGGYLRLGVTGQVRREEFVAEADTGLAVPDTVTGAVGVFGEIFRSRFLVVTHYNGFAREEDIDLSARVAMGAWITPSAFGYRSTGWVPFVTLQAGAGVPRLFARLQARAHGLFDADGLDSGRVWAGVTIASRLIPRQATVLHVEGGLAESQLPGAEFDLGHGIGPRAFAPHAFTGTRSVWGNLEHRVFLLDDVLGLLGVGLAAFLDYGGAWFEDQAARFGGDVGLGLRLGTTRSTGANVGRFDLAYQFGDGVSGNRWVFSFGRAFTY
jgi:hypothetical protein